MSHSVLTRFCVRFTQPAPSAGAGQGAEERLPHSRARGGQQRGGDGAGQARRHCGLLLHRHGGRLVPLQEGARRCVVLRVHVCVSAWLRVRARACAVCLHVCMYV